MNEKEDPDLRLDDPFDNPPTKPKNVFNIEVPSKASQDDLTTAAKPDPDELDPAAPAAPKPQESGKLAFALFAVPTISVGVIVAIGLLTAPQNGITITQGDWTFVKYPEHASASAGEDLRLGGLPECNQADLADETILDGQFMNGYECVVGCANQDLPAASYYSNGPASECYCAEAHVTACNKSGYQEWTSHRDETFVYRPPNGGYNLDPVGHHDYLHRSILYGYGYCNLYSFQLADATTGMECIESAAAQGLFWANYAPASGQCWGEDLATIASNCEVTRDAEWEAWRMTFSERYAYEVPGHFSHAPGAAEGHE